MVRIAMGRDQINSGIYRSILLSYGVAGGRSRNPFLTLLSGGPEWLAAIPGA